MLVPAILYKEQICKEFSEKSYSNEMINYTGSLSWDVPKIDKEGDGSCYQYAIVENNKLIGYFTYRINWYTSCACCFGLFSFDPNNKIIGIDVYRELKKIINDYHIHRIEWRMVGGNTVEKHYDRFCKRYNGNKFILTDAIKDRYGNYHNDIIYEIILNKKN